jgi:hypothetical protein
MSPLMDAKPLGENSFTFTYPVIFLLDPAPPVSFVSRPLAIGGHRIHVFTDEPAADDYLATNQQPSGVIKHFARNKATFAAKLEILAEQDEFTHLIIDDRGGPAGPKRFIAIKELIEHFKRNPPRRG